MDKVEYFERVGVGRFVRTVYISFAIL